MMSLGVRALCTKTMSTLPLVSKNQRDMDITGVMPTPPLRNSTLSVGKSMALNRPTGPCTASSSPSLRLSCNQLETLPPGTRLMVMEKL
ncbi:hypothetical protein D3C86_2126280 [compost metagenome]